MKARNAAVLAALAAFPAGQIAQQQGIIKFAGDVTIRESISIDQLPPIGFDVTPIEVITLTDADDDYTVPVGKRLRLMESYAAFQNQDAANYDPSGSGSTASILRILQDPSGKIDVGSDLNGNSSQAALTSSEVGVSFLEFQEGTVLQVRDNNGNCSRNKSQQRYSFAFQLIDA